MGFGMEFPEGVDPAGADLLADCLRTVFTDGTASGANSQIPGDLELAGKTGTTSDHRDAWFAGFSPRMTAVVWVGPDIAASAPSPSPTGAIKQKILTGATAALPIWIEFMREYIKLRGDRENPPKFEAPGNIIFVAVDRTTGETTGDPSATINEAFISGTQPEIPPGL